MARYRSSLPQISGTPFLCYTGLETDLIFNHGLDLPGFAAFPLMEQAEGRAMLVRKFCEQVELARSFGAGVILESVTWIANRDRAAEIGYAPEQLAEVNRAAIALLAEVRELAGDAPTVLSANVGPRGDPYATGPAASVESYRDYHREQMEMLAETDVDLVSGYTLPTSAEAAGMVLAAREVGLPVAIAFTVETDGRLPDGQSLDAAIAAVDAVTDAAPAYYMVNCAHPEHFAPLFANGFATRHRVRGVAVNASTCSHAELNAAETLDAGDPEALGGAVAALRRDHPGVTIVGGCCGTDARHLKSILRQSF